MSARWMSGFLGVMLAACSASTSTEVAPSDWVTYMDSLMGFEISHPDAWEMWPQELLAEESDVRSFVDAREPGDSPGPLYGAGIELSDFVPSVHVTAVATREDIGTNELLVDELIEAFDRNFSSELLRRESAQIRGIDGISVDVSLSDEDGTRSSIVKFFFATVDDLAWAVNCPTSSESQNQNEDLEICQVVLESFRPSG